MASGSKKLTAAEIEANDAELLARLGYKQELKRELTVNCYHGGTICGGKCVVMFLRSAKE